MDQLTPEREAEMRQDIQSSDSLVVVRSAAQRILGELDRLREENRELATLLRDLYTNKVLGSGPPLSHERIEKIVDAFEGACQLSGDIDSQMDAHGLSAQDLNCDAG